MNEPRRGFIPVTCARRDPQEFICEICEICGRKCERSEQNIEISGRQIHFTVEDMPWRVSTK